MQLVLLLRGVTFLRALGTMIHYAKDFPELDLHVLIQREREGKEYDTLQPSELKRFAPHVKISMFLDNQDVVKQLYRIAPQAVLTQDPYHHFPEIFIKTAPWSVFGISIFVDSLHHAWRVLNGQSKPLIPRKVYFPCDYIRDKFFALGAYDKKQMPHATLGAPNFDHSIFLQDVFQEEKTVLLMVPPANLTGFLLRTRLWDLLRGLRNEGWRVVVKDRVKTPLPFPLRGIVDEWETKETLMPYTSLALMKRAAVQICGYSTSVFEARYFDTPTLNLDIALQRHVSGHFVRRFGLTDLFNSKTSITTATDLRGAWDRLLALSPADFAENGQFIAPNTVPTPDDNASKRILRDVLETSSFFARVSRKGRRFTREFEKARS